MLLLEGCLRRGWKYPACIRLEFMAHGCCRRWTAAFHWLCRQPAHEHACPTALLHAPPPPCVRHHPHSSAVPQVRDDEPGARHLRIHPGGQHRQDCIPRGAGKLCTISRPEGDGLVWLGARRAVSVSSEKGFSCWESESPWSTMSARLSSPQVRVRLGGALPCACREAEVAACCDSVWCRWWESQCTGGSPLAQRTAHPRPLPHLPSCRQPPPSRTASRTCLESARTCGEQLCQGCGRESQSWRVQGQHAACVPPYGSALC